MANHSDSTVPGDESGGLSSYDGNALAQYFDAYGIREWERLVQSPSDEVSLHIQRYYLEKYISEGSKVLEIGAGAGRFTQLLAGLGARVLVADISKGQLELNQRFATELGFDRTVLGWKQVDACDLSQFEAHSFDHVVAYGGLFGYALDKRDLALRECLRVLRPGGCLLLSVMSLWGSAHGRLDGVLSVPAASNQKITRTGDLTQANFPERKDNFMHLFRAGELKEWLSQNRLDILVLSATGCLSLTWNEALKEVRNDAEKWNELLRMELDASADPGCLGMGYHLLAVAAKGKQS